MKNFIVQTFLPAFAAVLIVPDGQAIVPINTPLTSNNRAQAETRRLGAASTVAAKAVSE